MNVFIIKVSDKNSSPHNRGGMLCLYTGTRPVAVVGASQGVLRFGLVGDVLPAAQDPGGDFLEIGTHI